MHDQPSSSNHSNWHSQNNDNPESSNSNSGSWRKEKEKEKSNRNCSNDRLRNLSRNRRNKLALLKTICVV